MGPSYYGFIWAQSGPKLGLESGIQAERNRERAPEWGRLGAEKVGESILTRIQLHALHGHHHYGRQRRSNVVDARQQHLLPFGSSATRLWTTCGPAVACIGASTDSRLIAEDGAQGTSQAGVGGPSAAIFNE